MKIITTHVNPDFDGVASAVAAQRLFPDHQIVFGGKLDEELLDFIEEFFPFLSFRMDEDLTLTSISSLVIVDNSDYDRLPEKLKPFVKEVSTIVYDHHETTATRWEKLYTKDLGACITLISTLLMEAGIKITPAEATLFLTALYRSTLNFTLATTTPQDLKAASWLLESGASFEGVLKYLKVNLSDEQLKLYRKLLETVKKLIVDGIEVGIAAVDYSALPSGIFEIADRIWRFLGYDNLILLIKSGRRVFIIARSRYSEIDFGRIFEDANLLSHPFYTLGYLDNVSLQEVEKKIISSLKENVLEFVRVKDIMSSPVRTVLADMPVSEAARIMANTGHTGLPVIDHGKLVGMIVWKDVQKALKHGLANEKIREIMTTELVTVKPTDSIGEAMRKMVEKGVGRTLVVENGVLTGIVTRSDIMRSRYILKGQQDRFIGFATPITTKVDKLIEERLPRRIQTLLRFLGVVGDELLMPTYLVGGMVRDLLLNIPNYDIDVVVEGDARIFSHTVKRYFDVKIVEHKSFKTSSIFFSDGVRIDVATARTEFYEEPAVLPNVETSTIKKDLYRRDFSINAMAIKLNHEEYGLLLDFFGCRKDLAKGIIRILHNLSFIEDPTRILRAIRFEQRFGFKIEERTLQLLKKAVNDGYLERVTGQRLRDELEKILAEPEPQNAVKRMTKLDILKHLFPGVRHSKELQKHFDRLFTRWETIEKLTNESRKITVMVMLVLENTPEESTDWIISRYGFPKRLPEVLKNSLRILKKLQEMEDWRFSNLYRLMERPSAEIFHFIDAHFDEKKSNILLKYLKALESNKPKVNGGILIQKYGLKEGPEIKMILKELYCARLEGLPESEEEAFVRKLLKEPPEMRGKR
ncbi:MULTISPECIES: CBS domain-containing protein [unclassified Kosmotoga]|uniref:CBS domain-containing protein n=1 Tax=unclassified Kosmotoga TaxID=2631489 RepID=UPI0007C4B59E|nr:MULTISPECIES: CBS domain-containing protein [unclassified Kosmotoga]MDI3523528.1 hypothetical protein [Kosmotoga sp.]MDK2953072.1 hypothetical protein [Kosmotoga sp.]OAA20218.1 hypothetical protein DU53_08740 [Kosmotoga sp. DU53]